jgi:hypothetical protein
MVFAGQHVDRKSRLNSKISTTDSMAGTNSTIFISREEERDEYVNRYWREKGPALAEIHEAWYFEESEPEEPGDQTEQLR